MENTFEVQDSNKPKKKRNGCLIAAVIVIILGALIIAVPFIIFWGNYVREESLIEKYGGHGFEYMNGYSSTNFTGYHVYDGEWLPALDNPATLQIEDVNEMPVLDGAEACYPLYSALAKEIYKDIDKIELDALEKVNRNMENYDNDIYTRWEWSNGRIVTFTNTVDGYWRLIEHETDLFFGARPSEDVKNTASYESEYLMTIPIGREAFVFFVEEDNPVDNLTTEEVKKIYSGEITNWKEVGGKNQSIVAFQRPEESGSQVMMKHFMGTTPLMEADKYTIADAMGGVIENVKQYNNEKGAMGYTFQYFLTGLQQEDGVKMLSIDGVYPSVDHIKDGTYPAIVSLVVAKVSNNQNPNTDKVIEFLLSDQGQELVEKIGYGPLPRDKEGKVISEGIVENTITIDPEIYDLESDEHEGRLVLSGDNFMLYYDDSFIKGIAELSSSDTFQAYPLRNFSLRYGLESIHFTRDEADGSITISQADYSRERIDQAKEALGVTVDLEYLPKVGDRFISGE